MEHVEDINHAKNVPIKELECADEARKAGIKIDITVVREECSKEQDVSDALDVCFTDQDLLHGVASSGLKDEVCEKDNIGSAKPLTRQILEEYKEKCSVLAPVVIDSDRSHGDTHGDSKFEGLAFDNSIVTNSKGIIAISDAEHRSSENVNNVIIEEIEYSLKDGGLKKTPTFSNEHHCETVEPRENKSDLTIVPQTINEIETEELINFPEGTCQNNQENLAVTENSVTVGAKFLNNALTRLNEDYIRSKKEKLVFFEIPGVELTKRSTKTFDEGFPLLSSKAGFHSLKFVNKRVGNGASNRKEATGKPNLDHSGGKMVNTDKTLLCDSAVESHEEMVYFEACRSVDADDEQSSQDDLGGILSPIIPFSENEQGWNDDSAVGGISPRVFQTLLRRKKTLSVHDCKHIHPPVKRKLKSHRTGTQDYQHQKQEPTILRSDDVNTLNDTICATLDLTQQSLNNNNNYSTSGLGAFDDLCQHAKSCEGEFYPLSEGDKFYPRNHKNCNHVERCVSNDSFAIANINVQSPPYGESSAGNSVYEGFSGVSSTEESPRKSKKCNHVIKDLLTDSFVIANGKVRSPHGVSSTGTSVYEDLSNGSFTIANGKVRSPHGMSSTGTSVYEDLSNDSFAIAIGKVRSPHGMSSTGTSVYEDLSNDSFAIANGKVRSPHGVGSAGTSVYEDFSGKSSTEESPRNSKKCDHVVNNLSNNSFAIANEEVNFTYGVRSEGTSVYEEFQNEPSLGKTIKTNQSYDGVDIIVSSDSFSIVNAKVKSSEGVSSVGTSVYEDFSGESSTEESPRTNKNCNRAEECVSNYYIKEDMTSAVTRKSRSYQTSNLQDGYDTAPENLEEVPSQDQTEVVEDKRYGNDTIDRTSLNIKPQNEPLLEFHRDAILSVSFEEAHEMGTGISVISNETHGTDKLIHLQTAELYEKMSKKIEGEMALQKSFQAKDLIEKSDVTKSDHEITGTTKGSNNDYSAEKNKRSCLTTSDADGGDQSHVSSLQHHLLRGEYFHCESVDEDIEVVGDTGAEFNRLVPPIDLGRFPNEKVLITSSEEDAEESSPCCETFQHLKKRIKKLKRTMRYMRELVSHEKSCVAEREDTNKEKVAVPRPRLMTVFEEKLAEVKRERKRLEPQPQITVEEYCRRLDEAGRMCSEEIIQMDAAEMKLRHLARITDVWMQTNVALPYYDDPTVDFRQTSVDDTVFNKCFDSTVKASHCDIPTTDFQPASSDESTLIKCSASRELALDDDTHESNKCSDSDTLVSTPPTLGIEVCSLPEESPISTLFRRGDDALQRKSIKMDDGDGSLQYLHNTADEPRCIDVTSDATNSVYLTSDVDESVDNQSGISQTQCSTSQNDTEAER